MLSIPKHSNFPVCANPMQDCRNPLQNNSKPIQHSGEPIEGMKPYHPGAQIQSSFFGSGFDLGFFRNMFTCSNDGGPKDTSTASGNPACTTGTTPRRSWWVTGDVETVLSRAYEKTGLKVNDKCKEGMESGLRFRVFGSSTFP